MAVSAPQHSYDFYFYLGLLAPILFVGIGILVIPFSFIIWLYTKLFVHLCNCEDRCRLPRCCTFIKEKIAKIPFRFFLLSALKIIYGHDLVEHKSNDEPSTVTIYGREVGQNALLMNFQGIVFLCWFGFLVWVFACWEWSMWSSNRLLCPLCRK